MIDGHIVATDANGTVVVMVDALDSTEYEIAIDPASSDATFLARPGAPVDQYELCRVQRNGRGHSALLLRSGDRDTQN